MDRMVQALLEGSAEVEFVNLHDLTFGPCLGCAHLCAPDNHCKLGDDLEPYYRRIREAEALVLGTPNYFGSMNSLMAMFLERLWSFRHNRFPLKGKPFAVVSSGGFGVPEGSIQAVAKRMTAYRARLIGSVAFNSEIAPCFSCGDGLSNRVGSLWNVYGEEGLERLRKGADLFRRWEDCPEAAARIGELRIKLRRA
jgi:hypothetical protein